MIDTPEKLKLSLKLFKSRLLKEGVDKFNLYPMFSTYYNKNIEKYDLPKGQILDMACEILVEED